MLAKVRQEKGLLGWYQVCIFALTTFAARSLITSVRQGIQSQILKAVLAQALLFGAKEQLEEFTLRLMVAFTALKMTRKRA